MKKLSVLLQHDEKGGNMSIWAVLLLTDSIINVVLYPLVLDEDWNESKRIQWFVRLNRLFLVLKAVEVI